MIAARGASPRAWVGSNISVIHELLSVFGGSGQAADFRYHAPNDTTALRRWFFPGRGAFPEPKTTPDKGGPALRGRVLVVQRGRGSSADRLRRLSRRGRGRVDGPANARPGGLDLRTRHLRLVDRALRVRRALDTADELLATRGEAFDNLRHVDRELVRDVLQPAGAANDAHDLARHLANRGESEVAGTDRSERQRAGVELRSAGRSLGPNVDLDVDLRGRLAGGG